MTTRLPLLLLTSLAAMLVMAGAWAQDGRRQGQGDENMRGNPAAMRDGGQREPAQPARRPQRDDAMADSVRRIERSTRGKVIRVEPMQSDGRDVNRIKVMDDRGRVRVYMDDPQQRRPPTRDDDS